MLSGGVAPTDRLIQWGIVSNQPPAEDVQRTAVRELVAAAPVIERVGEVFSAAGFEIALVGGSVRDALLGRLGTDLDFTTSARPDDIERLLSGWVDARWDVGRAFGTIGAMVGEWQLEITTYRSESYDPDSRKPDVAFGDSLEGDLSRRDFAVNAMALALPEQRLVDPFGGLNDLAQSVLRTPGSPEVSFGDDPLRMMRAARFAAQLGFTVAPDVIAAMTEMAGRLEIISAERIRDELEQAAAVAASAGRAGDPGRRPGSPTWCSPSCPRCGSSATSTIGTRTSTSTRSTVVEQAIELEPRLPEGGPDLVTRLAALLHDIGKPRTRRFADDGSVTFHHHDVVGAKMTKKRMQALRFSNDDIDAVSRLVELHLRFHGYGSGEWTDSAVRRYVRDAGPLLERLHVLTRADCTTRNKRKAERLKRTYDDLEARIARLAERGGAGLDPARPRRRSRSWRSSGSRPGRRSARPTGSCSSAGWTSAR